MFAKLAHVVVQHRGLVAAAFAALFISLAAGGARLKTDFSVMAFFGGDDPVKRHFEDYRDYWGADDNVLIIVASLPDGTKGNILTSSRLHRLRALQDALQKDELVKSTFGIVDVPLPDPDAGMIDNRGLLERLPNGEAARAKFREQVLAHPIYVPSLLAKDASATVIMVETTVSSDDVANVQPMMRRLRDVIASHEGKDDLHFAAAGLPAVRSDFFEAFMQDQALFVPLGMLLIFLLLLAVFRSVHGIVIPMVAAFVPVTMTFGVMGWMGEPLGIINQAFTVLLPAIAVADAIHLVSRFHEEARSLAAPGATLSREVRSEAIARALKQIGGACALTTLTTAVGFASLVMARMPSMQAFGLYAAVGIVLAYATLLIVVPIMLTFVRGPVLAAGDVESPTPIDRMLLACGHLSTERPVLVLAVTLAVGALFAGFGTQTVADNNLTAMLKPDHPTTKANHLADEKLGGILTLEVDLKGAPGSLIEPKVLLAMDAVALWAKTEPDLRTVLSPATFVAALNQTLTGEDKIPDNKAAVAQLLLIGGGEALEKMLALDRSRARMQIRSADVGGILFTELSDRVERAVQERFSGTGVTATLTGTPHVAYRGINNITEDLRQSLLLAFFIITLIIGVLIRDLRVALLCLLPNALPLIVGYGLLGMTGWLLEPAGAVIFTVALGIAVDDTLHLIVRTREELRSGKTMKEALLVAVLHSGRAVTVTSLILCGGFGVLTLSSFPATVLMGSLGAIVIFTALLCDVFVLPALLVLFGSAMEKTISQASLQTGQAS